jgi:predicted transcriptional regulator
LLRYFVFGELQEILNVSTETEVLQFTSTQAWTVGSLLSPYNLRLLETISPKDFIGTVSDAKLDVRAAEK